MHAHTLKEFCKNRPLWILFLTFFTIYLSFGLYITFFNDIVTNEIDILFNADSARAYRDFLFTVADHSRIKAHPLQLILLQPPIRTLSALLHSNKAAVLIIQALSSAGSVCLVKNILFLLTKNNKSSLLFAVIYGLSISTLVFTAIPETYIFATLFNALFLYYICLLYKNKENLTSANYAIISLLAVFAFGIIPVSIIPNLILILWLFKHKFKIQSAAKNFLKSIALMIIFFSTFTFMQKAAYPDAPVFLKGVADEDRGYITLTVHPNRIKTALKTTFIRSLYATKCQIFKNLRFPNGGFMFGGFNNPLNLLPSTVLFGFSFWLFFFKRKIYKSPPPGLIYHLVLILLTNFIQMCVYGNSDEFFLYTQNVLIYLITLTGIIISKAHPKALFTICIPFISYQAIINFLTLFKIEKFVCQSSNAHYPYIIWFFASLVLGFTVFFILNIFKNRIPRFLKPAFLKFTTEDKYAVYSACFSIFICVWCIFIGIIF